MPEHDTSPVCLLDEHLLSYAQAARRPAFRTSTGRDGHPTKVYRATTAGFRGIILESIVTPGGRRTSEEAIRRFIAKLNDWNTPPIRTPRRREMSIAAAERELTSAGI